MVLFAAKGEFLEELAPGIRVVDLKSRRILSAVPRFAKYLRKHRPSVVISALEHVNVGAILARQLSATSIPVVMAIHSTRSMAAMYQQGLRRYVIRCCARWCYPRASGIVCVSHGVADDLASCYRDRSPAAAGDLQPGGQPADSGPGPRTARPNMPAVPVRPGAARRL